MKAHLLNRFLQDAQDHRLNTILKISEIELIRAFSNLGDQFARKHLGKLGILGFTENFHIESRWYWPPGGTGAFTSGFGGVPGDKSGFRLWFYQRSGQAQLARLGAATLA